MDMWRRAYTHLGFEDLDRRWERLVVYGTAAAFWVNLATWLITRDGIIPGIDGPSGMVGTCSPGAPRHGQSSVPGRPGPEPKGGMVRGLGEPAT